MPINDPVKKKEYDDRVWATPRRRASYLLRNCLKRAEAKNLDIDLDLEWIQSRLETGVCEVTKLPFVMEKTEGKGHMRPYSPSVDRIDSSGGYTKDNCRVVLCVFQYACNEWGDGPVYEMAKALTKV